MGEASPMAQKNPWLSAPSALAIGTCIVAGAVLRLSFPFDIEYKADEAWLFEHCYRRRESAHRRRRLRW